jgi:rRNA maturation endonuclease Nob1
MGVFDKAKSMSGMSVSTDDTIEYVCLECESQFEVQYHRCPECESFDVRCARWVQE